MSLPNLIRPGMDLESMAKAIQQNFDALHGLLTRPVEIREDDEDIDRSRDADDGPYRVPIIWSIGNVTTGVKPHIEPAGVGGRLEECYVKLKTASTAGDV